MHSNADVHDCTALNVSGRGETVRCVIVGCLPLVARASLTSALVLVPRYLRRNAQPSPSESQRCQQRRAGTDTLRKRSIVAGAGTNAG